MIGLAVAWALLKAQQVALYPLTHLENFMNLLIVSCLSTGLILERLFPRRRAILDPRQIKRWARNISLGAFYRGIFLVAVILPLIHAASLHPWYTRSERVPAGLFLVLDILIIDLGNFLTHWLAHRNPFLWRFHAVHHSDSGLDVTTAIRTHFFEKALFVFSKIFLVMVFGIPFGNYIQAEAITLLIACFHHSNIKLPEKLENLLKKVMTTPAFHEAHHHAYKPYTDSNYGFIFTLWDQWFHTQTLSTPGANFVAGLDQTLNSSETESFEGLLLNPFFRAPDSGPIPSVGCES